ncbi:PREDICTED: E3 ubiquitin-protein ligase At1g63170 [Theobroma cacao]|uniref:E3 ubiquitin-protein ligase At1g63170 n=1 Tax=Theobroma cacao TaxID=3641 RepID=A0AB32WLJ0_THECC|nr:PREDICTED: E3 ubiquitin-protein ligase At1g63170 [Theobroma cacao]XP_017978793.1 PREDICTED: E3 ubiquitin-protein ligase At1g63170 [Theobroma cacao]
MDSSSLEESSEQTDRYPLLMERVESHSDQEHIIDITRHDDASSSSSHDEQPPGLNLTQSEDRPSSSTQAPTNQTSSSNRLNSRNSSFMRRSDGYGRRRRSPLNSGLWISVELVVTVSQIIASIVVLSLSRNEKPQAPLFAWIVGYASGCIATLPILYWRFRSRNQGIEQDLSHSSQGSSHGNPSESTSYTAISVTQASDEENNRITESATRNSQIAGTLSTRLNGLVDHFKMALDCFFAVWFVVGNVWIFGGHSSPSDAPKLYRLCIVFLTFSCIGYAMPFILCATICCCLPCIISVLGFREDFSQTRGATVESINALPIYKFKSRKSGNVNNQDNSAGDSGILAAGTAKERAISGEDAVCCICLAKYADNDELRELPCIHVFHVECVDKWLKINASCPLCKSEVGESSSGLPLARD